MKMKHIIKENFSNYIIFSNGSIFSIKTRKFLGLKQQPNGYLMCTLTSDDGQQFTVYVHRFIYEAFNTPIPKGLVINHLDENKLNNSIDNLSLMTHKENANYGTRNQRISESLKKRYRRIELALSLLDDIEASLNNLPALEDEND